MREYSNVEDVLDEPYVVRMILTIEDKMQERGYAMAGDFKDITTYTNKTNKIALGLDQFGICEVRLKMEQRLTYNIRLTEKGKEVSAHLRQALELMHAAASERNRKGKADL